MRAHDEILVAFTPAAAPVGFYILQAVLSMAIGYILSRVFAPSNPTASNTPAPSQVYGIAPPKNAARLGQPIPVLYGSVIALPDFASQPYVEFVGNDQFLCAVLCLGLGEYDVIELLLGQTQASTLQDGIARYRVWLPSAHASTFGTIEKQTDVRENVVTSPAVGNQELVAPNAGGVLVPSTWYWALSNVSVTQNPSGLDLRGAYTVTAQLALLPQNPTLGTVVHCVLSFDGSAYRVGDYTATAYDPAQQTAPGALIPPPSFSQAGTTKWVGYFATCKPGQRGSLVELDYVFPGGLYTGDASGNLANCTVTVAIEAQPIDDAGNPAGALQSFSETFVAKDNTPQRLTKRYAVPSGRYKVRVNRSSSGDLKVTTSDHVIWAGLKFQLDPPPAGSVVYGGVTLISLRLRATNVVASDAASSLCAFG